MSNVGLACRLIFSLCVAKPKTVIIHCRVGMFSINKDFGWISLWNLFVCGTDEVAQHKVCEIA